jgi:hypothetical protein
LAIRADLKLYVAKKIQSSYEEQPWNDCEALRESLRSKISIEQDLEFSCHSETEVNLSMLQHLLDLGINPNHNLPSSDKSVWYDFLLSLETDFPKKVQDPAWDMNLYLDPSAEQFQYPEDEENKDETNRPKAVWLPNWNEACELMILAGANALMHTVRAEGSKATEIHIFTKDIFEDVFPPEQAQALIRLSRYKEAPKGLWSHLTSYFFHS